MSADPPRDPRLEIIWEEGRRAVELQAARVDEVRGRAGALLGAGGLAAAFFASTALDEGQRFNAATWTGAIAFAVLGLLTVAVLWPRTWKMHRLPSKLLRHYVEGPDPNYVDDMLRDMAVHLEADFTHNKGRLKWMYWGVTLSCLALVVEIGAFLWDLRGRR